MTVLERGGELLKVDTLGRVRTSRARREAILDEFERSGGSGQRFAGLLGIKYPTFASWIQGRRRERKREVCGETKAAAAGVPVWLEAVVEKAPAATVMATAAGVATPEDFPVPGVRVHLPGGARVELAHLGQAPLLAALLRKGPRGRAFHIDIALT